MTTSPSNATSPPASSGSNHHPSRSHHAKSSSFPHLKLVYFQFGGRAEPIRLAFHVGDVPFDDIRITEAEFMQAKYEGRYPFGSVPVLEVDGVTYAQSVGILRYVGRLGGLYPEDALEGLKVDQVVGGVEDLIVATVPYLFASDADKPVMREKLEKETYKKFFGAFERLLKDHGQDFFCGDKMTVADLAVYPVLAWLTSSVVTPTYLEPFPLLSQLMDRVRQHPKVYTYYQRSKAAEEERAAASAAPASAPSPDPPVGAGEKDEIKKSSSSPQKTIE